MCKAVNKNTDAFDIYIGRGSKWGNPYAIGEHGTRIEVIAKYRLKLWSDIKTGSITISDLKLLNGARLGCFCKPRACHGDVIARAVKWAMTKEESCYTKGE